MELKREYYSLEEAVSQLKDYSLEDINHFIETGKILPCLYSSKKKYVAVTWDRGARHLIAHATCSYRGLLKVHKSWIESLWDKGEIKLNRAAVPLDRSAIRSWNTNYPYKGKSPSAGFGVWEPMAYADLEDKSVLLIPLAKEGETYYQLFNKISDLMQRQLDAKERERSQDGCGIGSYKKTVLPDSERYAYGFEENGRFNQDDLRLLPSHIEELMNPVAESVPQSPVQTVKVVTVEALPWTDNQKGGARVNEPLERLFRYSAHQPAKTYWRLLREGYERFDPDNVIEQVTNGEIHWYTRSDELKVMAYKTFENKISNIKKYYRANQIEVDG